MPPYAPGGLDTWDNLWLQRSAAHPWCGMRNMASLDRQRRHGPLSDGTDRHAGGRARLACILDRTARRARRDDPKAALPTLARRPSEYVCSGRYFQSIEIPRRAG